MAHTQSSHPEQAPGEVFLTNCSEGEFEERIGWPSKRMGSVAYDVSGKKIPHLFPVFISEADYQESQLRKFATE